MMHSKKGFTLIELMIVIIIMGVLASVAVPKLTRFIERTYRSTDATSALEIAHILRRAYFTEEFKFNQSADNNETSSEESVLAVVVTRNGITYHVGNNLILPNGTVVDKLFSGFDFSSLKVKAHNTDGGWDCYGAIVKANGQTSIFSSADVDNCRSNVPNALISDVLNTQTTSIVNYVASVSSNQ